MTLGLAGGAPRPRTPIGSAVVIAPVVIGTIFELFFKKTYHASMFWT